jgi:hypothetical protein
MTTATKTQTAYSQRGLELVRAWGGDLSGRIPPDKCPVKHMPTVRCSACGNTPPRGALSDAPTVLRETRWMFWYGGSVYSPAPNAIDLAMEAAVVPSPEHIAAETLLAAKQAAYTVALRALELATAEHDKARGETKMFVRDGLFFTTGGRALARLERAVDDARRGMEDAELDLKRARGDVAEHEEFVENQKLVWRDKHRAEFA